jgi:hypothetical protein
MHRIRTKLTYANVVASLALFIALAGGTAFAASQFEKNSIPGRAIKQESIGPAKLSKAAKSTLVGPAGPAGPAGAPGAPGATKVDVQYGIEGDGSFAHCPAGQVAVGGGGEATGPNNDLFVSQPMTGEVRTPVNGTPNGWFAKGDSGEPAIAFVVCAAP